MKTDFVLQLGGASPHFHKDLPESLNAELNRTRDNYHHLPWRPSLPHLNQCNFFL